ncbi:MAG: hypothetical protein V7746_19440 [Halioglobus sp.]
MSTITPKYTQGLIELPLNSGQLISLSPQECWDLVEMAGLFLIENSTTFEKLPARVITKNEKSFAVGITKNISFWNAVENNGWEPDTIAKPFLG